MGISRLLHITIHRNFDIPTCAYLYMRLQGERVIRFGDVTPATYVHITSSTILTVSDSTAAWLRLWHIAVLYGMVVDV